MIILTGGAGFIGSAVLAALNEEGVNNVLVVDNLGTSEKWRNLVGKSYVDCLHKDQFLRLIGQNASLGNIEAVIHMGACSSTTVTDANYVLENNYRYSRNLGLWAVKQNARFIYASSAATYGDGSLGFSDENGKTLSPLNLYGYSKDMFDTWAQRQGLLTRAVGLKFFNVYGPNEYHKVDQWSVILKAFREAQERGAISLFKSYRKDYKDGEQMRDFVYVKDCTKLILWLLKNPAVAGVFNVGTGKARSWNDLAKAVFSALGKKPKINYVEMPEALRDKYQYFTEATINKLRSAGYTAEFTSLEDGVRDYVVNYLLQGEKRW